MESPVAIPNLAPGDVVDSATGKVVGWGTERFDEKEFASYLASYAGLYEDFFAKRRRSQQAIDLSWVALRMKRDLLDKLAHLTLAHRIAVPLYYRLTGEHPVLFKIDFQRATVSEVDAVDTSGPYRTLSTPTWQAAKVLAGEMSWENFVLTFRVRLSRKPDVYDPLVHAFLTLGSKDIGRFCRMILRLEASDERIVVATGCGTYSTQRYCPHNGGIWNKRRSRTARISSVRATNGASISERAAVAPRTKRRFARFRSETGFANPAPALRASRLSTRRRE